ADHERLDALLRRAFASAGSVDSEAYDAFRRGLLRHIGMEEKILLPAAQRAILAQHNAREEGPDGVYAACERLAGAEADALAAALCAAPEVPVHPHVDSALVAEATRRAVARAGYDPIQLGL